MDTNEITGRMLALSSAECQRVLKLLVPVARISLEKRNPQGYEDFPRNMQTWARIAADAYNRGEFDGDKFNRACQFVNTNRGRNTSELIAMFEQAQPKPWGEQTQPSRPTTPAETPAEDTQPMPVQNTQQIQQSSDKLAEALREALGAPQVEEQTVRAIVRQELTQQDAVPLELCFKGVSLGEATGQHPKLEKVLKLVCAGVNVMMVGRAGSGKTHLAEQIAKHLKVSHGVVSCNEDTSSLDFFGTLLPADGGAFRHFDSPMLQSFIDGGLPIIDEIDAASPNALLAINSMTANGSVHIAARTHEQKVTRGEWKEGHKLGFIAIANTFGTGADAEMVGRNILDGATRDRWYIVEVDYDQKFEQSIAANNDTTAELYQWIVARRKDIDSAGIRRVLSTRALIKGARALSAGFDLAEVKTDLTAGWTQEELRAAKAA